MTSLVAADFSVQGTRHQLNVNEGGTTVLLPLLASLKNKYQHYHKNGRKLFRKYSVQ